MTLKTFLCFAAFLATTMLKADGFHISVSITGYDEPEIYLAHYYGNSQYIDDTAAVNMDGKYVFSGDAELPGGIYLIVLPPDNQFFQLLVNPGEQHLEISLDYADMASGMEIRGSEDNRIFYQYLRFLSSQRPKADALKKQRDTVDENTAELLDRQIAAMNARVWAYQDSIIRTYPKSLTALTIKANTEIDIPDFRGGSEEIRLKNYRYYKAHYFDHYDMRDPRIMRTPFLFDRVDTYINRMTIQAPDSIAASIDTVLHMFDPGSEAFKYYLIHFLNTYARSKIVGMDAVYVHLVEKYYKNGLAPWTEEDQLNKIIRNAEILKPILLGKTAPDLQMQDRDQQPLRLHDIDAEYVVLFFWDPDCGHCKKSIPQLLEFSERYRDKGVEMFAVCTRLRDEVGKCWEAIDEKKMNAWINVVDPYLRSRFKQVYDIRTTPQIYVLDRDKKIVMKKIGAGQLPEVLDTLIEKSQEG